MRRPLRGTLRIYNDFPYFEWFGGRSALQIKSLTSNHASALQKCDQLYPDMLVPVMY